jgi:hypothetical protein
MVVMVRVDDDGEVKSEMQFKRDRCWARLAVVGDPGETESGLAMLPPDQPVRSTNDYRRHYAADLSTCGRLTSLLGLAQRNG